MSAKKKASFSSEDLQTLWEESQLTADLYYDQTVKLRKEIEVMKKQLSMQSAEILMYVDRVKQEYKSKDTELLATQMELNEAWGFIGEIKDLFEDDEDYMTITSLLDKYNLGDGSSSKSLLN